MEITVDIIEEKFEEYNKLYFGGRLLWPYEFYLIRSFRCFGRFSCNHHSPGSRLRNVRIGISMYYDWTEEYLRDVLCTTSWSVPRMSRRKCTAHDS